MRDGIQPRRPLRLIRAVIVLSLAAAPVVLSSGQAAAQTPAVLGLTKSRVLAVTAAGGARRAVHHSS